MNHKLRFVTLTSSNVKGKVNMAKKNYYLTLTCSEDGCKESTHYSYSTRRDYNEAQERYRNYDYKCLHHSREGQLSRENRRFEGTETYILKPRWVYNGYELGWVKDGKEGGARPYGDTWSIGDTEQYPNGTTVTVETKVWINIPKDIDPMPEWTGINKWYRFDPKLEVIDVTLEDAERVVIAVSDYRILLEKAQTTSRTSKMGYRIPSTPERNAILDAIDTSHIKIGQVVQFKVWQESQYEKHHWKEGTGTIIERGDWHTVKILPTPDYGNYGRTIEVYKGHTCLPKRQPETVSVESLIIENVTDDDNPPF